MSWTLRRSNLGFRLCVIPCCELAYLLAGAGYFFFLILVSFLLMHVPSDVQCCFLVYVVFLN